MSFSITSRREIGRQRSGGGDGSADLGISQTVASFIEEGTTQWRRAAQTSCHTIVRQGPGGRCLSKSYDNWLGPGAEPLRVLCSSSSNSSREGSVRRPVNHSLRVQSSGRIAAATSGCVARKATEVWIDAAGPLTVSTSGGEGLRCLVQFRMNSRVYDRTISGSVVTDRAPVASGIVTEEMPPWGG